MAESVHCSANRPCNHGRYWSKFRNFGLSLVTFTDYITKMISVALILLSCLGLALSVYQRQSSRSSKFSERLIIMMLFVKFGDLLDCTRDPPWVSAVNRRSLW